MNLLPPSLIEALWTFVSKYIHLSLRLWKSRLSENLLVCGIFKPYDKKTSISNLACISSSWFRASFGSYFILHSDSCIIYDFGQVANCWRTRSYLLYLFPFPFCFIGSDHRVACFWLRGLFSPESKNKRSADGFGLRATLDYSHNLGRLTENTFFDLFLAKPL